MVHYGLDLGAKPGSIVRAPEAMEVLAFAVNDKTKPLTGYGPAAILAKGASGVYHVIGHMDAWGWSGDDRALLPWIGRTYVEGEVIGTVSKLNHVHWEVRTVALPARGADRAALTLDPRAWLRGDREPLPSGGGGIAVLLLLYLLTWGSR